MNAKTCIWATIVSASLAATPVAPLSPVATVVGRRVRAPHCLALTYGRWTVGDEPIDDYKPLPTAIALLDSLFWPAEGGRPAEYWVVRLPGNDAERRRAMWSEQGDSLILRFPNWWSSGLWMELRGTSSTLRGRATVYVDYSGGKSTSARVTAITIACPSTIPAPR